MYMASTSLSSDPEQQRSMRSSELGLQDGLNEDVTVVDAKKLDEPRNVPPVVVQNVKEGPVIGGPKNIVPDPSAPVAKNGAEEKGPISRNQTRPKSKNTIVKPKPQVSESAINPRLDNIAVALKTGKDVALQRTPIQIMTYLQAVRNLILIGDGEISVGDLPMVDVIGGLFKPRNTETTAERIKREQEEKRLKNIDIKSTPPKGEAVTVDEQSEGWRSDGNKNLPGFRELWTHFPDADWFVMIDDDTYVFFDNLADILKEFDPKEVFYIGAKNMFIGCDGVKNWGEGPYFAHGGSGIVLSRGAMKVMMAGLDACIEQYKTCWAGDVRTALCLRDQGILLNSPGGFHKDPPNDEFWFPRDPCQRPATFHHLLVKQIQRLYDLERKRQTETGTGRVTFADIYNDWHNPTEALEANVDRKGSDILNIRVVSAEACNRLCRRQPECLSFVFDGSKCWLKNQIPPPVEGIGFISGIIPDRYRCTAP
ncbi:hypothetical protein SpCBS45565_g01062 [Spizellomyces sp. 'palustris']|nr:hypothetical protein SpCBS45565_g01062 [Spizellomyces sp. 'palustris']